MRNALKDFVAVVESEGIPKRIFKSSGVNRRGDRFKPYIRLKLWHHHLGRNGDPLLVLQKIDNDYYGIALTKHAYYTYGDKCLWLKMNMAAIDWAGCKDILQQIIDYEPPPF